MTKQNKKISTQNYLDYIPILNDKFKSETDETGSITICIENKGMFNRVAQLLLKKPKVSKIHLDEMGNFIWPLMDGERTVYDISLLVKEKFGDAAEPLYDRLVQYMHTLENYEFIKMRDKKLSQ